MWEKLSYTPGSTNIAGWNPYTKLEVHVFSYGFHGDIPARFHVSLSEGMVSIDLATVTAWD